MHTRLLLMFSKVEHTSSVTLVLHQSIEKRPMIISLRTDYMTKYHNIPFRLRCHHSFLELKKNHEKPKTIV
jgi:hypothetical protein